ncbi:MAG: efflux RND transporter permease subunit [Bacteroidales bacterium]|nr:efflux RND transporter permease subunit [Bacteroidales bacterium]
MENEPKQDKVIRNFGLTTLSLKNKNTVFLLTFVLILFGMVAYVRLPKELFPDVVVPTILVQTAYPGNSPADIENLITRPIEKEIDGIKGIKNLTSQSLQDLSFITVEFNTGVDLDKALKDVKDAVDRAKSNLPDDLLTDPVVKDIDFSEFPIITVNLSGDYSIEELRKYAEYLQDEIETVPQISRVDVKGMNDREIKIIVDPYKLKTMNLSFRDIENAVSSENISMSGGEVKTNGTTRSIRIIGEFTRISDLENIIVKQEKGEIKYLKDVAKVVDGFEDPTNYARLDHHPVVSLQVVKKGGENLLEATDQIFSIVDKAKKSGVLPANLIIDYTNDQSDLIRKQLSNLENNMIMGVILVVLTLFYFMGIRNALIVGLAIPMSMFISFLVMSIMGIRLNMITLFSLILALGMLVDNAIVVVENIYRFIDKGYKPWDAAKQATGEIAVPIIASTATTLAAFFPMAFWGGRIGEFMKMLPIMLIIVLTSSLFVALVIVPVFSASFIRKKSLRDFTPNRKKIFRIVGVMTALAVVGYVTKSYVVANLLAFTAIIIFLHVIFFYKAERWFQKSFLIWLEEIYSKSLRFALRKKNPWLFFTGTTFLLVFTIWFYQVRKPNVDFFPINEPRYINVGAEMPIGTDITRTDSMMKVLEYRLDTLLKPDRRIIKNLLTTVGKGNTENRFTGGKDEPNKGLITINFVDYKDRQGISTSNIMARLSNALIKQFPGVRVTVEKNAMGPPTGKPINLEISGEDFNTLIDLADSLKSYISRTGIEGIEGLKMDLDVGKPELIVHINREKARRYGLSTQLIAGTIRTSLYGRKVSDFKVGEDEYPITLHLADRYRNDVSTLLNQTVSLNEMGKITNIPISAVTTISYSNTYGAINRKDRKRVITLYSNVLPGFNANQINKQLKLALAGFNMPPNYDYSFTGEQQDQKESMDFLSRALLIALSLILIILVTQFNSIIRPLIIMASVVFSTIGVFGGLATFKMDFVVIMTGIGIISLAGIVVNNAIVLIDYIELLKTRKRKELGLEENAYLPVDEATACIIQAGKTRLRPVLLTAITTVLGLISLAVGLNMNFGTLLSKMNPQLYFGGDNVMFWGPMSWTVIFGLTFSTFLTLVVVPVMYRLTILIQKWIRDIMKIKDDYLPEP